MTEKKVLITDAEKEELIVFITNSRKAKEKYWWIGIYDPNTDSADLISDSLRGGFKDGIWQPIRDEYIEECCQEYVDMIATKVLKDAFDFEAHCTTEEHVRNLVNSRTDEQLAREYQYMLEVTMEALEASI